MPHNPPRLRAPAPSVFSGFRGTFSRWFAPGWLGSILLPLGLNLLVMGGSPGAGWAQAGGMAEVVAEENLRAEPNGDILGQLAPGTRVQVEGTQENWTQVTVEGYVWTRSMQIYQAGGLDLIISESGGENLRDEPQGRIAGRFEEGAQLEELGRVPGWVNIRRTGWIWSPSIAVTEAPGDTAPESPTTPDEPADPTPSPPDGDPAGSDQVEPDQEGAGPGPTETGPESGQGAWIPVPEGGVEIRFNPQGGRIGMAEGGADLRVLSRDGEWARVQLEGWVRMGDGPEEGDVPAPEGVTPADLRADPDRFQGREVTVELQFISVERAEAIRTEFQEGEAFLLTRASGGQRSFVYVAITEDQLAQAQDLGPLERLRVTGRVRAEAARFTGNPILDLVSLERIR